jgi:putative peptidoglycan lipid II flippase
MQKAPRLTAVAGVLAGSVLLSRVLGYLREAVLARELGASASADAYYAAFQIPDLLNYLLAGGALSIAFVPFYSRVLSQEGRAAAEELLARVTGTIGALAVAATALLWWQAEALVALQFPRFAPETQALTVRLTRILLPAQVFFIAGGIVRAALMAHGRFATQALAPLVYNGSIIAGGLLFAGSIGAEGFAWGALVGAAVGTWGIAWLDARLGLGMRMSLRVTPRDAGVRHYLAVAVPLMFGLSLAAADEWYDRWFGGLLATGTVASLAYARRLMQLPVAVVGGAIATAALPTLSRLWSEGRREALDGVLRTTLQVGIGLSVLAAGASFVFAAPIVDVVYRRGAFGSENAAVVSELLRIFSIGVPAWVVQQIAVRAFYARSDTWRPMLLGTVVSLGAVPLYLAMGPRYGGAGLAAAGVLAMAVNALATLLLARRLHGGPALAPLAASLARGIGIALLAALPAAALLRGGETMAGALRDLVAGGAVYGSISLALVFLLGDAPLRDAVRRLTRRLAPRRAPPADTR